MNSKERVYAALNFQKPDRVPRFVWFGTGAIEMLTRKYGISPLELELKCGNDILQTWVSINGEMMRDVPDGSEFTDEWGITWKREGFYNMAAVHPLQGKDVGFIKDYRLPDPYSAKRYKYLEYLLNEYGDKYFIGADVSGSLFEPAYHLRNMEDLMVDMALGNEAVDVLLDKLVEFTTAVAIECVKKGVDWIWLGDDLGSQKSMLMSPATWRKYFKPRMKRIIDAIRAVKKDIFIAYHSCGSMYPVIGDLVEIGINVLNPIQESAEGMVQEDVKKEFGDRLALMCGVDTQQFLVDATPEMVRDKTCEIIEKLGYNGGFIFAASHHIQQDTPEENIRALFQALDSCG